MTDASLRPRGAGDDRFPEGWKMSKLLDGEFFSGPPMRNACVLKYSSFIVESIKLKK